MKCTDYQHNQLYASFTYSCGNVAAILELNDNLESNYKIFEAAVGAESRGAGLRKRAPDYFL
jgi:serine/threonine-protein phosphatase 4 catalytic subunit